MSDASVRQGTVARLTSEAVTLIVDGATMALATQDIRRIETPDRMSDGVSKGAIGLAIVGGVGTGLLEYSLCAHDCAFSTMKTGFVGAALGAALGAVMGGGA